MWMKWLALPALLMLPILMSLAWSADVAAEPGPYDVEVIDREWTDPARDRVVPVRIYLPEDAEQPAPVIVFSHGLGGTREGYGYLGQHWASHGYVSVHLQHIGSDDTVWRGTDDPMAAMRAAISNPQLALDRPADASFAMDTLAELNAPGGELEGRLDLERAGIAGHSFGAFTTLAIAGQGDTQVQRMGMESCKDDRFIAAIPMSAPVPARARDLDRHYAGVDIPCFHMTGTEDDSPVSNTTADQRRIPFDHIGGVDQILLTFQGGDHMIFSGRPRMMGDDSMDATFQSHIAATTLAFWDAYLKADDEALDWLYGGGLEESVGDLAEIEIKQPE
jgi:pimeloyl-ACP methyl ester carboxylesterase